MRIANHLALISALLLLAACGSSHKVTYSGHQESTEGVPGFVDGKKVSPHVKLGQSYTVDGETFVPRYQPDYEEEGMASWYGPGFHGGKTANGEEFDKHEMTAAHRTLPLPSIVRVTYLKTGKSAYVRINDRGPFSKGRIIDLSYAAANAIGMIGAGTGKVRVEYMPEATERFTALLADGRDPKSIDVENEVLNGVTASKYAGNTSSRSSSNWWNNVSPVSSAQAATPDYPEETEEAAPLAGIATRDLAPPPGAQSAPAPSEPAPASPFAVMANAPVAAPPRNDIPVASAAPPPSAPVAPAPVGGGTYYVQLGAFSMQGNAERLRTKFSDLGSINVIPKPTASGSTMFLVRAGPYSSAEQSQTIINQLRERGVEAKIARDS